MAESDSSATASLSSSEGQIPGPSSKKAKIRYERDWKAVDSQRLFKDSWRKDFFVIPHPTNSSHCLCLICRSVFTQLKTHTIKRHFESRHKPYVSLEPHSKSSKYERLLAAYESERRTMLKPTDASKKQVLASYKLAYIVCKHKHPFSAAEDFIEFARLADPESEVFSSTSASRCTVTRRVEETAEYILRRELISDLNKSHFFCLLLDDSLDKSSHEQCILMVRYVNFSLLQIETNFLGIVRVIGTPNATTITEAIKFKIENDLSLPTQKLICVTTDGASVMQGSRNSVSVNLLNAWNAMGFRQHCVIHKEVLGVKNALKEIPPFVEETVGKILEYFKFSAKCLDKFEQLVSLTNPNKVTYKLVQYCEVRWLSLNKCVKRIQSLLPELTQFFLEESEDTTNTRSVRDMANDLFVRTNNLTFRLYIEFLHDTLPLLDDINLKLQTPNIDMYKTYCTLQSFRRAFAVPVLKNVSGSANDSENHVEMSEVVFHGANFNKLFSECQSKSDLTEEQLEQIRAQCIKFILRTVQELDNRFPESKFIIDNFSFLNPNNRSIHSTDIMELATRFSVANPEDVSREYSRYLHDQNVDDCWHHCQGNLVKLWAQLQNEGYSGLSNIAFGIMAMCPENASCERAFSIMKYIKNDQRTCLTQLHLDNALRIAMDPREPSEFPYEDVLKFQ